MYKVKQKHEQIITVQFDECHITSIYKTFRRWTPDSGSKSVLLQCLQGISREMMCGEIIFLVKIISRKMPGNPVASFTSCSPENVFSVLQMQRTVRELKYLQTIPEHANIVWLGWRGGCIKPFFLVGEIHTLGLAETCKNQEPSDKDANSDWDISPSWLCL